MTLRCIPANTVFTISTDYGYDKDVHGVFRALVNIDPKRAATYWMSVRPEQRSGQWFDRQTFIDWLLRAQMIERVPRLNWNMPYATDSLEEMSVEDRSDWDAK